MHQIHETKGYILSSIPNGEANKLLNIFTPDFGLVRATAQGIRYEKSKLKFATQDYSLVTLSIVRGRGAWRLVNAVSNANLFYEVKDKDVFNIICRMFSLLSRLLQGEEANVELFDIVDRSINFLKSAQIEKEDLLDIECVIVLRILNNLGYIGDNKSLKFFVIDSDLGDQFVKEMKSERQTALNEINRALRESHL